MPHLKVHLSAKFTISSSFISLLGGSARASCGCLVPVVKEDFHWTNNNTFEKEIVIKYDKTTNSTF